MSKYVATEQEQAMIERSFKYFPPKDDQTDRYVRLRLLAKQLAEFIVVNCPPSDEKRRALHKVNEAVMWANASVARNEP